MSGVVSFTLTLATEGETLLPEIAARVRDLSPLFEVVVERWAEGNARKWAAAIGAESSGVEQESGVDWQPLTEDYRKSKRRRGWADQLMHATGELEHVLETPEAFFQYITPVAAQFGLPQDPEDLLKVEGNWETRQALFLDVEDMEMIEQSWADYVNGRGPFRDPPSLAGLARARAREEQAEWDLEFREAVEAEG